MSRFARPTSSACADEAFRALASSSAISLEKSKLSLFVGEPGGIHICLVLTAPSTTALTDVHKYPGQQSPPAVEPPQTEEPQVEYLHWMIRKEVSQV